MVALIAVNANPHESAVAAKQSVSMIGRPGSNPLRFKTTYHVEQKYFDVLKEVSEKTYMNASKLYSIACGYANPLPEDELAMGALSFKLDTKTEQHTAPLEKDMDRIIANIQEARRQADYVLISVHSHTFVGQDTVNPAEFLKILPTNAWMPVLMPYWATAPMNCAVLKFTKASLFSIVLVTSSSKRKP